LNSTTWLDNNAIIFLNQIGYFVILQDNGGYNHIALYDQNGNSQGFLTSGNWEVTTISYVNETSIFFFSTQKDSTERHLYSINWVTKTAPQQITSGVGYYSADFSGSNYILYYNGPNIPTQTMKSTIDLTYNYVIEDNSQLAAVLSHFALPTREFLELPTNFGNMNAFIMYPPNFDQKKKYKLLMHCYGGPGSQMVLKTWKFDYDTYLASQLGIIIASVDGRGTGGKGNVFKNSVYKNLGNLESYDQVGGALYFNTLPFVSSIGIWGWSYGGYLTLKTLERAPNLIKFAVSVAPVSDWRFYDTVYTERYMLTPALNPTGYTTSSTLYSVCNITSNSLLLMHGTGDDNVHFQNTVEFANVLIKNNIMFETIFFPNQDHSIVQYRRYLYSKMNAFLNSK